MTIHTHVYVERGGDLSVSLGFSNEVEIWVKPGPHEHTGSTRVYIPEASNPELYARLCKVFGLQKETAPGLESEDGEPAGNESERAVVHPGS